jgi:hypothetical protein
MDTMKTATKTPKTETKNYVPGAAPPDVEAKAHAKRKEVRARKIAGMMAASHPFAAGAMALHQQVSAKEEEMQRLRSQLMAILRTVP